MAAEKALALVIRTTDWSETSRIATLWTREHGRVRALAKGGRRLKSNFETALDLLTVCSIVFLRKSSGGLDLLTEAQVVERFGRLRHDLPALFAGYYVAELLADWTEDYDPHPALFDEARSALQSLGEAGIPTPVRLARFECVLLRELGYSPVLDVCAGCTNPLREDRLAFCAPAGGMLCPACQAMHRDRRALSAEALAFLRDLCGPGQLWRRDPGAGTRGEIRQLLNYFITYSMGRRPRLLPYLGS
jgi:DNA repair protein RecO (recombination protein O)